MRVKQKTAITRVLDNATALPETKADVIEALKRTDSFIRKIRTLLIDKDVEDIDAYLNEQLTSLFNVAGKRYYVRKLKDFYALWYMLTTEQTSTSMPQHDMVETPRDPNGFLGR